MKNLKAFIKQLVEPLRICLFALKWRRHNRENETYPVRRFPMNKVNVGRGSYGPLNVYAFDFNNPNERLDIGTNVAIADKVSFILGGEHNTKLLNAVVAYRYCGITSYSKGPILIEDDVWIGHGALILSGARIGKGSFIGGGAVITKEIPPYSIVTGCNQIRERYNEAIVNKLKYFSFDGLSDEEIRKIASMEVTKDNVDYIVGMKMQQQKNGGEI